MPKTHVGQILLAFFGVGLAYGVTLENTVSTDFTSNFRETAAVGTVSHQSTEGGFLRASTAGSTAVLRYDTAPATATADNADWLTPRLSARVRLSSVTSGSSFGFLTRVQADGKGILGLVNVNAPASIRLRLFYDATETGTAGTNFYDVIFNPVNDLTVNSWFRVELWQSADPQPRFALTVFDDQGLVCTSDLQTLTAEPAATTYRARGSIGMRLTPAATTALDVDDFSTVKQFTSGVSLPAAWGIVNVRNAPYNAVGDGVADDTAAIQQAIRDNVSRQGYRKRILYLPKGTYRITAPLEWKDNAGNWRCGLTLQGESADTTILRLDDNAAAYQNKAAPKAVIFTASDDVNTPQVNAADGAGNQAFSNYLFDFTVQIGAGNPGAIGIDYCGSNSAAIQRVRVTAPPGSGVRGIHLGRLTGPALLKDLEIEGFDYALYTDSAYNTTCEDIRISGQGVAGIYNQRQVIHFRRLHSINSVPALSANFQDSHSTFVDCELLGGSPGTAALQTTGGLLARNITSTGYANVIGASGPAVSEYATQASLRLHSTATHKLNLPSRETPDWFWSLNPGDVANVADYGANPNDFVSDSAALQAAFNSGKPVILFPPNTGSNPDTRTYTADATVNTTAGTRLIAGLGNGITYTYNPSTTGGPATLTANLRINDTTASSVRLDRFGVYTLELNTPDTVVMTNFTATSIRNTAAATGPLLGEDVVTSFLWLTNPQDAWLRQINCENRFNLAYNDIEIAGGKLWIFGFKTEKPTTLIRATAGSSVEILGGWISPIITCPTTTPAFIMVDADFSASLAQADYGPANAYTILVRETRGASTRELLRNDAPARFTSGSHVVRFLGHNAEQTPLGPPGDFAANPVGGQVQLTWLDMANAETGYEVQRRPGNSATWSTLGTTAANASGFTDTTPDAATEYFYRARAIDTVTQGAYTTDLAVISAGIFANPASLAVSMPVGGTAQTYNISLSNVASASQNFSASTPTGNGAAFNIARSTEPGGPSYGWIDIGPSSGSPGTQLTFTAVSGFPASDEGRATFNLPAGFSFPYFGTTYAAGSPLYVGTNGFITPTIFTGNTYQISDLSTVGSGVSNMIAPFWRDLDAKAGSWVGWKQTDANTLVISFLEVRDFTGGGSNTFQVILKTDGSILFQYQASSTLGYGYSIGVKNADRTQGLSAGYSITNTGIPNANSAIRLTPPTSWLGITSVNPLAVDAASSGNLAVRIDPAGLAEGIYSYDMIVTSSLTRQPQFTIPVQLTVGSPAPAAPSAMAASSATIAGATLNWTDNSSNETGFEIQRSADGATWLPHTSVAANTTSHTDSTLLPGSLAFYRVSATGSSNSAWSNSIAVETPAFLDAWRATHFSALERADLAICGFTSDPDGDGLLNGMEAALGLNPRSPSASPLVTGTANVSATNYLSLAFPCQIRATDLRYTALASGDLSTWAPVATAAFGDVPTGDGYVGETGTGDTRTITARDTVSMAAADRRFMRLLVEGSDAPLARLAFSAGRGFVNVTTAASHSGLTNPGFGPAFTSTDASYLYRHDAGLAFTAHPALGGGLRNTSGETNSISRSARLPLSPAIAFDGRSVLYASFLLRTPSAADADLRGFVYFRKAANGLGLGAGIDAGNLALVWRDSASALQFTSTGTAWLPNTTYLFIVKLSDGGDLWAGNDPMEVWVNPVNRSNEAAALASAGAYLAKSDLTFGGATGHSLDEVLITTQNLNNGQTLGWDEIRLGTTWSSVAPPAP